MVFRVPALSCSFLLFPGPCCCFFENISSCPPRSLVAPPLITHRSSSIFHLPHPAESARLGLPQCPSRLLRSQFTEWIGDSDNGFYFCKPRIKCGYRTHLSAGKPTRGHPNLFQEPVKANLARIRDNQRRSRARRKEYVHELEQRVRLCELQGIEATSEIQVAARKVAEENKRLRALLHKHGVDERSIGLFLQSGTVAPNKAKAPNRSDAVGDAVHALDGLLGPRRPSCLIDSDPGSTPSASSPAGSSSSIVQDRDRLAFRGKRQASESSIDSHEQSEFYTSQQPLVATAGPALIQLSAPEPSKPALAFQEPGCTLRVSHGTNRDMSFGFADPAQPSTHTSDAYGQTPYQESFPASLSARASRMSPALWHHLQTPQPHLLRAMPGPRPATASRILSAIDENNGDGETGVSYYLDGFAFQQPMSEYSTDALRL